MAFEKHFEEIGKKIKSYSPRRLWLNTSLLSIVIFIGGSLYLYLRRWNYDLHIANKVFASTALILIGLSLAISGLCYFWNFFDTKIGYRKYLGIAGFAFAIVHIIITSFFLPEYFLMPDWIYSHWASFIFGLLALIIFIILASISNRYAVHEIGGRTWRKVLRYGGYSGFIFIIIHYSLLKYNGWVKWFTSFDPILPPLSLVTTVFSLAVIVLRLALWISVKKKQVKEKLAEN